jgi:serralysin
LTTINPQITLCSINEAFKPGTWLMSDWAAGQTSIMNWEDQNVRKTASGNIELVLGAAPTGSSRPFNGAEFQSYDVATTGTWSWTAQAPKMVDGAVFGMFTYRADWKNQPWVEFDFEFVGKDTTKVQLNIHMADPSGRHISLDQAKGGPIIVDLGFDASQGMHTYDVTVSDNSATFRIDGKVVGVYGAKDMPGGVWQIGPQKSYVDLWCASGLDSWTGKWAYDGTPLVAVVQGAAVRPGDLSGLVDYTTPTPTPEAPAIEGDDSDNNMVGTADNDTMNGRGGNDTMTGLAGNDTLFGGEGNDILRLDAGNDILDGGQGLDWVEATGTTAVQIDLSVTTAQNTGHGNDIIRGIENAAGGDGNDVITGSDIDNMLRGNGGNDIIWGRAGNDIMFGGAGNDRLTDGGGNDQLFGDDGDDELMLSGGNDLIDGGNGSDWLRVNGTAGATVNLSITGPQNTGYGTDTIRNVENLRGSVGGDRLTGNAGANIIEGLGGNDIVSGGAGADILTGGAGRDILYGGLDTVRDVFVFNQTSESAPGKSGKARDLIYDFASGIDDIDLRGIDARTNLAGDQAFAFSGGTAAAYSVWAVASGSDLLIRGDVNGDRVVDFEIQLIGVKSVTVDDFLL